MPTASPQQQLDVFLDRYTPEIAAAARRSLRDLRRRVPGATEMVYDNYNALGVGFGPDDRPAHIVFSIVAYPRWVTLFFMQGAGLADPAGLLRGSGTRVRHIVLATAQTLASTEVDALIGRALQAAKVPINPRAKRVLLIKSVVARQRPRRPADTAARATRTQGVDLALLKALALTLPGVTDTSTVRGFSFKAGGKLLACKAVHRSAEPGTLLVRIEPAERDRLIKSAPQTYYLTPHYLAHSCVLVRLAKINRKALESLLMRSCAFLTGVPPRRKRTKAKRAVSVFQYL